GVLPGLLAGSHCGRHCIVPAANALEAALPDSEHILLASHLLQVLAWLQNQGDLPRPERSTAVLPAATGSGDFADAAGQAAAKRALLVAAAGGHNLLLRGPPGTGKTMLASRLPSILPPLSPQQAMESAALRSIAGHAPCPADLRVPPFR